MSADEILKMIESVDPGDEAALNLIDAHVYHKPSTIKRQFYDPVAAVLHYAHTLEWIPYIRVNKPQVTLPPPEWAEPEYFEKLFKHCDKEVKALTMFLCLTGCRISECLDLEWKNVDLKNKRPSSLKPRQKRTGPFTCPRSW